ncbi:MAG: tetratricopeptide repeat protein [Methylococcales bacterium]
MEPTTIATVCTEIWKSETFQHFLSEAASRIVGEYTRHKFIDNTGFQGHGGNTPELAEAERRYLEATNDREQQGLELQKLHLACLYRQSQENIALSLQKLQSDQDRAHWSGLLSRDETVHLLTGAKNKHRLLLVLSEPDVSPSCPESFRHDFPREARAEVKQFIEHHYPLSSEYFPVEFYGKFFCSTVFDNQVKQLENTLSVVPGVVLYSDLTDEKLYLHLHTWGFLEPLSKTVVWNWEDAQERLLAEGHAEKQALRAVRQVIVALYQSFAALLADLYYLHINPLHEPVLLGLKENKAIADMMVPHLDYLKTLMNQVKQAYEASLPSGRAHLAETQALEQDYAEFIKSEDHSEESAKSFLESRTGRLSAWRALADQGSAQAQCLIGKMFEQGLGVDRDYKEAMRYYSLAAEQGLARGQSCLGYMYEGGRSVTKNEQEALRWYRKAAEQGDANGQAQLGRMYYFCRPEARNFEEAVWWLRKAADQGGASYEIDLGFYYWLRGDSGEVKYFKEAVIWYRKAAEQGNRHAQFWLGGMYCDGKGIDRNYA